jgi:hypothetical protein
VTAITGREKAEADVSDQFEHYATPLFSKPPCDDGTLGTTARGAGRTAAESTASRCRPAGLQPFPAELNRT